MLRLLSFKRIVLTAAIDWLGTLAMLLAALYLRAAAQTFPLAMLAWPGGNLQTLLQSWPVDFAQPQVFLFVALLWPFFLVVFGAYDERRNASLLAELLNVLLAICVATLTLAGVLFLTYRGTSRLLIITFLALDTLLLLGLRLTLWTQRLRHQNRPHPNRRQVLVLGTGQLGRTVVERLQQHAWADL